MRATRIIDMTCGNAPHVKTSKFRREYGVFVSGVWYRNPVGGEPCLQCGLPVGISCEPEPANDTPDVLVEIRAVELEAQAVKVQRGSTSRIGWTTMELIGWRLFTDDDYDPRDSGEWAGWLGRAIFTHDETSQT